MEIKTENPGKIPGEEPAGILEEIGRRRIFFDGGTGSLLQAQGLKPGELPETWNLLHPDIIEKLHRDYLDAGADVVTTNTFGANRFKFGKESGYDLKELVEAAVGHARKAIKSCGHGYAALDLGPTGKLLKPYGTLDFEEACDVYKEVVRYGAGAGADLIIIETMGDSYELKAAVLAAKESCSLPVFATVTLDEKGKMLTGGNVESVTALLEGLGVDVIGLNCGLGPVQLKPYLENMVSVASVPVMVNPNAGLPRSEEGQTVYDIDSDQFAGAMEELAMLGASVLGGCCGTTPEHIKKAVELCRKIPLPKAEKKDRTVISSYSHAVVFGERPVIIGERINPTGKPKFKQALKDQDMEYILNVAVAEQEGRADVLDVNVGLPGIDEPAVMEAVVKELQSVLDLPLQIDTSDRDAMERAMRIYNGKPLINSVNGKKEVMEQIFPLVKHYGGVVVALCLDEDGIPETVEGRLAIAKKIYDTAASYGIEKKDILVDALCMAVSSDKNGALTTLETVRRVRTELGGKTVLGVSNVSFGLPVREQINGAFFLMALREGLSAGIINPNSETMMSVYDSFLVLTAKDPNCGSYIGVYGEKEAEKKREKELEKERLKELHNKKQGERGREARGERLREEPDLGQQTGGPPEKPDSRQQDLGQQPGLLQNPVGPAVTNLKKAILKGMAKAAKDGAMEELLFREPLDVIQEDMIPALNEVGKGFETGSVFLPQLLMSAEAAGAAFSVIKEEMAKNGQTQQKRGKIVLATVQGDIHDIGKNIVRVLLENYGFDVIDLGRDVPAETVVETVIREQVPLVGLSALMTTTVPSMAETIRQLREKAPGTKVMVGGAVLTEEYAVSIGADAYCRDAMASVNYAMSAVK